MKYIFSIAIITMMIFVTSCTKNSSSNFWSFEGNSYSAAKVASSANVLEGSNSEGNAVGFTFYGTSLPTTTGTYSIVYNIPTAADQVAISLTNNGGGTNYYSSGTSGSTKAYITVSGGRISISVPSSVTLVNGSQSFDSSTSFTASISL